MFVYLIITRKCNCHCSFCIRNNLKKSTEQELSLEALKGTINLLADAFPKSTLVISGGEPFLFNDWDKLVEYSLQKFSSIVIPTNGTFNFNIQNRLKDFLRKNLFLQISLDGTRDLHDKLRGKGVFDSAIQNITGLEELASRIILSTTVGVRNAGCICDLATFLNNYKFRYWKVSLEQVCHPGADTEIDYLTWNQLVDRILPKCAYEVHIKKQFDFNLMDKVVGKEYSFKSNNRNCGFGKNKIYIDTNLDVYPCSCIDLKIGNLKEDSVKILKAKFEKLGNISPSDDSPCFNCKYRQICNGGCPGYSYKYFGSLNKGDIRCPIVKGSLK